jgi:VanZ family protein
MISSLFKFLDANHSKVFWGYITFILLMAVKPLNGLNSHALNNIYIVEIRLDHLLHGILFLPWFFISIRIYRLPVWVAVVAGIGLAVAAEGVQYFLPYRAFNVNDMISNVIGMMLGLGILVFSIDKDARHTAHDAR